MKTADSAESTRDGLITVRVSSAEKRRLEAKAASAGVSVSELVRSLGERPVRCDYDQGSGRLVVGPVRPWIMRLVVPKAVGMACAYCGDLIRDPWIEVVPLRQVSGAEDTYPQDGLWHAVPLHPECKLEEGAE